MATYRTNKEASRPSSERESIKSFLKDLFAEADQLTWLGLCCGLGVAVAIALLLISYRFQYVPKLNVGDIAPKDIRALRDITIQDVEATQAKRREAALRVPAVYDFDPGVLANLEKQIRASFSAARNIIEAAESNKKRGSASKPNKFEHGLIEPLRNAVGGAYPDDLLSALARYKFSQELEDQIVKLLKTAMTPGVVSSHSTLLQFRENGIRMRDVVTGYEQDVKDVLALRDVNGARASIRQNQFELLWLDADARRKIVGYLESLIVPNLMYNLSETQRRQEEAARAVSPVLRQIKQGKVIVSQGDEITESALMELEALRQFQRPKEVVARFLGALLIASIFLYVIWRYLAAHQTSKARSHFALVSLVLLVSLLISRLTIGLADMISELAALEPLKDPSNLYYAVPYAFGAILITLLIDANVALLCSIVFCALVGILTGNIGLACYALVSSFMAIYGIRQYGDRTSLIRAGLMIGVINVVVAGAIDLLARPQWNASAVGIKAICGMLGGAMTTMFASSLLPVLESLFKITTDIRLLELSNLNTPILRRMAMEAPGTYHHSIMVGTLAEAAAEAVGANPLLVRVAAYYHDIGKLKMPEYYIENQLYMRNKHEDLSPSMSCLIIASHVKDGLEMAKEIGLMPRISDMIPQHHGTRLMTYFYQKAKEASENKNCDVNEADFRYPGPKPQTKEAAILMIADAVEAASRTLTDPTPAQIQGMIKRIIDSIVADGQLDECDITMRDLDLIAQSMLKILVGIYHHRIQYPGYDFERQQEEASQTKHSYQPAEDIPHR